MKIEPPHHANRNCVLVDATTALPPPRLWTLLDYMREFEPERLVHVDELDGHLDERQEWLAETEWNLYRQPPTMRYDGERLFDIALLSGSQAAAASAYECRGLETPGGHPADADILLMNINTAELRMERDTEAPPELTARRRAAILAADIRLLELGVSRAGKLGWGPQQPQQQVA